MGGVGLPGTHALARGVLEGESFYTGGQRDFYRLYRPRTDWH